MSTEQATEAKRPPTRAARAAAAAPPAGGPETAPATRQEDLEKAAMQEMLADQGHNRRGAPRASHPDVPRARARQQSDPEVEGAAMQRQLINQELRQRERRQKDAAGRRDRHGRRLPDDNQRVARPIVLQPVRRRSDPSVILDSKGQPAGNPRWVKRWVREKDHAGRELHGRVEGFIDFGFEIIIDPHTKKPIRGPLGLAVQAPPQQYALRALAHTPTGAFTREELESAAYEMAEGINRQADDEVCFVYKDEKNHGSERTSERVSTAETRGIHGDGDDDPEERDWERE